jgi:predicted DNA-binding transcriptional regulator AlpA
VKTPAEKLGENEDLYLTGPAMLLTARQVGLLLGGISERKIHAMQSAGQLPRPVRLDRLVRWRRTDLEKWIASMY